MSTKQGTVDYILDQLISLENISTRKMFGEYALYHEGKVVGLICNDTLYIKITEDGRKFVGKHYKEGYAYDGAKVSMQINEDQIDDHEWLSELVSITSQNLPLPKPKKIRTKSKKNKS